MSKTTTRIIYFKSRFRICSLFFIGFLSFCQVNAQIPINSFSKKQEKYLETLISLARHLKSAKTPTIFFHETEVYADAEKFYDRIIDNFFAKARLIIEFEKDTSVLAVEAKFDLVRHVLNVCDIKLDILSEDSILIGSGRDPDNSQSDKDANSLNIFLKEKGKKTLALICEFDENTNKLLGFSLVGSEKE
jgi:hypothetical protein